MMHGGQLPTSVLLTAIRRSLLGKILYKTFFTKNAAHNISCSNVLTRQLVIEIRYKTFSKYKCYQKHQFFYSFNGVVVDIIYFG